MYSLEDAMPVYRPDDNEHMGYVAEMDDTWLALTMFGCPFARAASEQQARATVLDKGLQVLTDVWEYYDPAAKVWERCVIIEASPATVRVTRMDGPSPDPSHSYTIANPSERTIRKPGF